ncbi:MAG: cellulase family glycosylhydrolase [Deltaproteobacteria bacterium]|nr:cellulase family glycosylhydrolase [Deltaproteobacteria bacterium]
MRYFAPSIVLMSSVGLVLAAQACSEGDEEPTSGSTGTGGTQAADAVPDAVVAGSGGADGGKAGYDATAKGGSSGGGALDGSESDGSVRNDGGETTAGSGAQTTAGSGASAAGSGGEPTGGTGGQPDEVERPSYNTGTGFFVANGTLYDANGVVFRIRGVNKLHFDVSSPGIAKTHANTVRLSTPLFLSTSVNSGLIQDIIDDKMVPMPAVWYTSDSWEEEDNVTCKSSHDTFNQAMDLWIAYASVFKPFERYLLVNIANEWGPEDSTDWRDTYIDAVGRLRDAGYLTTLVIDSGGCGQDPHDIAKYAQAVFDSDPQKNIIFDVHIYGMWANGDGESWQNDLDSSLDSLASTGLPIIIGEFGPGRNIGPSPTEITPQEIIAAAEARGMGWLAWAWDDGDSDNWFALSYDGDYGGSDDLTTFGKIVVEDPTYGLLHLAQPATSFTR